MHIEHDNKFFSFMSALGDFILLNILFLITSLPIITIGPAFCAHYCCAKKRLAGEESYIIRDYFSYFTSNFKNAFLIWGVFLIESIVLFFFSQYFVGHLNNIPVICIYFIYLIWYIFTLLYAFPLQATFINRPIRIILNAFLTAFKHLPYTLLLSIAFLIPLVFTWLFPGAIYFTAIYWALFGCSLYSIISVKITSFVFKEYIS